MKKEFHPELFDVTVVCACGSSFKSSSTKPKIEIDICSSCHPLFTGTQKFIDRAGRIEKFKERYAVKPQAKTKKKK